MELDTSWSNPHKSIGLVVILAGLATSAIVLGIVHAAAQAGVALMGYYADGVLPVSAILVGLAAGSGYAVATWLRGVRVTAALCIAIVILQIGCYTAAEYLEYRAVSPTYEDGTPVSFPAYFDHVTRSWSWKGDDGKPGKPFGTWGYGIRALEVAGFAFGGLIGALIIMTFPYCHTCQVYMKKHKLLDIPASIPPKKIKKTDAEALAAYRTAQEDANKRARQAVAELSGLAVAGKSKEFRAMLMGVAAGAKGVRKAPISIRLETILCRQCGKGQLKASTVTMVNNRPTTALLNSWDLPAEVMSEIHGFDPRRAAETTDLGAPQQRL